MDDLIATGITIILILVAAVAVLIAGIVYVLLLVVHALATGDIRFILTSLGLLLLLCAGYAGAGLWLHRAGRI
jgi:phosphoribosylpyrophosphate synthetase